MENNKFVIRGEDFCCTTITLLNFLLSRHEQFVSYGRNTKYPGQVVWYFKMNEDLRQFLEKYLKKEVVWEV